MTEIWFTADTHFFHKSIIKYANRPFESVEEMNMTMVENWNARVKRGDIVYHLGDFAFLPKVETVDRLVKRLNGNIHLIRGNHDRAPIRKATKFAWQGDVKRVKLDCDIHLPGCIDVVGQVWLSHYEHLVWPASHYGCLHFFGHHHCTCIDHRWINKMDVGVDLWHYRPVSLDEIMAEIKLGPPKPHHLAEPASSGVPDGAV